MWKIELLENEVELNKKFKEDFKKEVKNDKINSFPACDYKIYFKSGDIDEELFDCDYLFFNPDHFEHMDYLSTDEKVIELMKKHKLKGDIKFGCLDGDQFGQFWGYRFDGKGNMKHIKGKIVWK